MLLLVRDARCFHCPCRCRAIYVMVDFIQDPISRIYAVILILMTVNIAVIGYNFNRDTLTAEKLTKDMLSHSDDRYKRTDANDDKKEHAIIHVREQANAAQLNQAILSAAVIRLEKDIETLPRPPSEYVKDTKNALTELRKALALIDRRLYRIEDALISSDGDSKQ